MPSSARSRGPLTIAGIIALAIAVSVTAVFLARWQWHRHEGRANEIAAFTSGQAAAPSSLSLIVPDALVAFPDDARWRTATVSGSFDPASLTWLRNRPVGGKPATHALAWFVTDDDRALLVDTGWVAAEATSRPTLPSGRLTLTVTLRPTEEDNGTPGTRITPGQMPLAPAPVVPGYGVMKEACAQGCGTLPGLSITPLPQLSLGPHLAYTVQWLMLAAAAPVVGFVWIRRELQPSRPVRTARHATDEEIEDAL